jgi:hypothetical protein
MVFKEITAVYIRSPQMQHAELQTVKADGTYSYHWTLNGYVINTQSVHTLKFYVSEIPHNLCLHFVCINIQVYFTKSIHCCLATSRQLWAEAQRFGNYLCLYHQGEIHNWYGLVPEKILLNWVAVKALRLTKWIFYKVSTPKRNEHAPLLQSCSS